MIAIAGSAVVAPSHADAASRQAPISAADAPAPRIAVPKLSVGTSDAPVTTPTRLTPRFAHRVP